MKIINTRSDFFKGKDSLVIVELGVFDGEFSKQIMVECKPQLFFLVDKWDGDCFSADTDMLLWMTHGDMNVVYFNVLKHFQHNTNVLVVKYDSVKFFELIPANYVDIVYIDTTHAYEQTKNELNAALPKVKTGGYICGHDYFDEEKNTGCIGVKQAVTEFCKENNLEIEYLANDITKSFFIQKR